MQRAWDERSRVRVVAEREREMSRARSFSWLEVASATTVVVLCDLRKPLQSSRIYRALKGVPAEAMNAVELTICRFVSSASCRAQRGVAGRVPPNSLGGLFRRSANRQREIGASIV